MGVKTRFLQLSDIIMMEYSINPACSISTEKTFLKFQLPDEHYAIVSPSSYEIKYDSVKEKTVLLDEDERKSVCTINHLAVPTDSADSFWYTFLDSDFKTEYCYADSSVDSQYTKKFLEYKTKLKLIGTTPSTITTKVQYDTIRLYFVNGYDFSNIFGVLGRFYTERNDGSYLDLCDMFINKATAYNLMTYMSSPVIFGDNIYDRYIELNIPSINDLKNLSDDTFFDVNPNAALRISFSYVESDSYELSALTSTTLASLNTSGSEKVNCSFTRGSNLKGVIPIENVVSDNLGLFIAENPDYPYFEFYGTWQGYPLDTLTVQQFNNTIKLYDVSMVHNQDSGYEVDEDYVAEVNYKKWVAMHEIECNILDASGNIIKNETYQMSQLFIYDDSSETKRFYYRPVYFDTKLSDDTSKKAASMVLNYTMRFMNVDDKVQFIKKGSISTTNVNKYFGKSFNMPIENITPFKVYNKTVESVQSISGNVVSTPIKKYINVFYDSATIFLEDSNGDLKSNYTYVMNVSEVSKNYKFVFKKTTVSGKTDFLDLSNGYYKLYFKDSAGADNVVEPTYSSNMNVLYGELEFSLSSANITKLMSVPEASRKMSIVSCGDNGTINSMYDFKYTF